MSKLEGNFIFQSVSTAYYPLQAVRPQTEVVRMHHNLVTDENSLNDVNSLESCVDIEVFNILYGVIYCDLTNQEEGLGDNLNSIDFYYILFQAAATD